MVHYLAFNHGLYCLPNLTHLGDTSLQSANADTMAGVIISKTSLAFSDSSKRHLHLQYGVLL